MKQIAHFTANLEKAKDAAEKTRQQYAESQHREKVLVRRLAAKEQEIQDYVVSKRFKMSYIWMKFNKLYFATQRNH